MTKTSTTLIALCSLGLIACGDDPPAPSEVRSRIATDLHHILQEASAAAEAGESVPGTASLDMIDRALGSSDTEISARVRAGLGGLLASRSATTHQRSLRAPEDGEDSGPAIDADAAVDVLTNELFTDANHRGEGIFEVPASLVCMTTTFDQNGNPTSELDAQCAEDLATVQPRIRVSGDDDTLRFALQIGAAHREPVAVTLEHTSLAVTVDLDEAWQAAGELAPLLGEDLPSGELAGQLTASLEILGTAHARAQLSIDRALVVTFSETTAGDLDPESFRFTSEEANVLAITLDGTARTGALVIDVGATTFQVEDPQERLDLDLPGLSAVAMFTEGQPLQITHLGLGDRTTTVSINGAQAMAFDLNPSDGRAFGASISLDPTTGAETIAVEPKLDFRSSIDHAVLGDEPPVYDVTQVLLEGSLRSRPDQDRVEVVTGSLALATNPASYGFTATTGQCVTPEEVIDVTTDRYYTQWTVGSCQ